MKKYKTLAAAFLVAALFLSHAMCIRITSAYAAVAWGIFREGNDINMHVALFTGIPCLLGVVAALIIAFTFWKKSRQAIKTSDSISVITEFR